MSGFKDIFGDTRVPIVLKGKTHIFEYIAKKNEISFFSAIYALIRFFQVDYIFFILEDKGVPSVLGGKIYGNIVV